MNNETIFITGGAGFIGSTLVDRLSKNNKIVIFDNLYRHVDSSNFSSSDKIRFIKGDVLDYAAVSDAMHGSSVVIHLAGIAGIDTVIRDPINTMEVNIMGTANVLKAASKIKNLKRFLDFSTSEIFGSQAVNVSETDSAVTGSAGEARWTYAVSKLAGEHLTSAYHRTHKLPSVVLRPFNIYGPGQIGEGAMQIFIKNALNDLPLLIDGDGSQIRAWCYVDDFVEAVMKSLDSDLAIGESFNIGNARAVTTILGLANMVIRILNSKSEIVHQPPLSADIAIRIPTLSKAKELLNFEATVDLDNGILKTAQWYASR